MNKISVYVKNSDLLQDIKLLAVLDNISLTEIVEKALSDYAQKRKKDIDNFLQEKLKRNS